MTYKIYLPDGLNAVTEVYIDIIKAAIVRAGHDAVVVSDVKMIGRNDGAVTINDKYYVKVAMRRPKHIIHWFQGITPEEIDMTYDGKFIRLPKKWMHRIIESMIFRGNVLKLFVSDGMRQHYQDVYGYCGKDYVIMPCFNATLDESTITGLRYQSPTFVYAGSLDAWQCFEPMLELFKEIKQKYSTATLTIYTFDKERAKAIAQRHGVEALIDCVPSSKMNDELKKYKYGFIIRESSPVNYVASPTKMSTYMASGVIPLASDVVETFKTNLGESPYVVLFDSKESLFERIDNLESCPPAADAIAKEYKRIFSTFWNKDHYISEIAAKIVNQK